LLTRVLPEPARRTLEEISGEDAPHLLLEAHSSAVGEVVHTAPAPSTEPAVAEVV
jgi:hypothetical protein